MFALESPVAGDQEKLAAVLSLLTDICVGTPTQTRCGVAPTIFTSLRRTVTVLVFVQPFSKAVTVYVWVVFSVAVGLEIFALDKPNDGVHE